MVILLLFAFVSGLITIFAPCIWPLLPIVLSSSSTGGKKKPFGITLGLVLSFGILTLFLSYLIKIFPLDANALRLFAVIVIGFLGLTLIIPQLSSVIEGLVSKFSGKIKINSSDKEGFTSGFITGVALGVVWTPCAGPILATIAALAATQSVNLSVVLVTFFYIIGVSIPLFMFATLGNKIFSQSKRLSKYTGRIQQIFGFVMIITAILIYTNYDKFLQVKLLDVFPSFTDFVVKLESNEKIQGQLDSLKDNKTSIEKKIETIDLFNSNYKAAEFTGITKWLNTDMPLSLNQLKGKVVLVDFWTYTCINCIRTLPYVTSWYEKYKDMGFVVIGVHTPEFEFEKETQNVQSAIKQYKINYPVAQDNDYKTWNAYNNRYWPAEYLIDANGIVRRVHFGEGEYDKMESAIQKLLEEKGKKVAETFVDVPDQTPTSQLSPETYIGLKRMERFASAEEPKLGTSTYSVSGLIPLSYFAFNGKWDIQEEYSSSFSNSSLSFHFVSNKVFLVMHPSNNPGKLKVFLDGKIVSIENAGLDVKNGEIIVDEPRLYELIDLKGNAGEHTLKLEFQSEGIKVFAFTFG